MYSICFRLIYLGSNTVLKVTEVFFFFLQAGFVNGTISIGLLCNLSPSGESPCRNLRLSVLFKGTTVAQFISLTTIPHHPHSTLFTSTLDKSHFT